MEEATANVGVIVGRFQVPDLHRAHRDLIEAVAAKHRKVVVALGVAPVRVSHHNPLDYFTRELMIKRAYPRVVVLPIRDMPSDSDWSAQLDGAVETVVGDASVLLYGSRDSFIPRYSGRYRTVELAASHAISGTEMREAASSEVRGERAFRVGVIYAVGQKYPTSYQCVDVAIWKADGRGSPALLLGRKRTDPLGRWRFVGGFVSPLDPSLEVAAAREAAEETGWLGLHEPRYMFSARVTDWRYRSERDGILTAVFSAALMFGEPRAADDMDELRWFGMAEPPEMVEEHAALLPEVLKRLWTPPAVDARS